LRGHSALSALTADRLRGFARTLFRDGLSSRTRATLLSAVRSYLRYLIRSGHSVPSPDLVEIPKIARKLPELDERLVETVEAPPPPRPSELAEVLDLRDRAALLTLYSTQLRVAALCRLNRGQIDPELGVAVVVGKGQKTRSVFFGHEAIQAIELCLQARADHHRPLFLRHDRAREEPGPAEDPDGEVLRITTRSVERLVKRAATAKGVKATPHSYRHYGATAMVRAGMDIRSVQEALGHASVATTQIYTHVNPRRLRDDWLRYHPAARSDSQRRE
jgi:site-specific recombinase XerD